MSRIENTYKRGYCVECGNPVEYCCCAEIAFTSPEYVVELQELRSVRKRKAIKVAPGQDCTTCDKYCCTECPIYTIY